MGLLRRCKRIFMLDIVVVNFNMVNDWYSIGARPATEVIGAFVFMYIVFSATNPKCNAGNPRVHVLAPLEIGFAVFLEHLAAIPITGSAVNPATSFGPTAIFNDAVVGMFR